VAALCGLSEADVVAIHAAGVYRVYMMGFTPGFPYLGGMSPRIAAPRLPSPRTFVPAGSVGLRRTRQESTDGESRGWRLIGRTPVRLFDPAADPPALVEAGDVVRFVPVSMDRYAELERAQDARPPNAIAASGDGVIEVLEGGMLTTVQDLGRIGFQRFGVPVAGAMDTFALRAANRLVGNADTAAGLEITLAGPTLRVTADTVVAATGADLQPRLNGRPLPLWRGVPVRRGDVLTYAGQRQGIRGYLAVRGGIAVPVVLRSRATYLTSAFGGLQGRALRAGDTIPLLRGEKSADTGSRVAPVRAMTQATPIMSCACCGVRRTTPSPRPVVRPSCPLRTR